MGDIFHSEWKKNIHEQYKQVFVSLKIADKNMSGKSFNLERTARTF
jgi:hypothetical protein